MSKGHKELPNVSLIPENDPTVLFTTAGMHPLVPYLLGQKHPLGKRLCSVQKCIRTQDIDEVGDTCHHTFFEMLGNWSIGDYFKKEAIEWSFEFLTKILNIPKERMAVSVFAGDEDAPRDDESANIWVSMGIKKERIAFLPKKDNWWGPAGKTGPCGPDTEMFYWKNSIPAPKKFIPEDKRWVEVWNDVLMQYHKDDKGNYVLARQKNVDTGMGVERTIAILQGFDDNYLTEIWKPIIEKIEKNSGKKYGKDEEVTKAMRIIADHLKASVFILADGVIPDNAEQGYVLRRLIRRAVRYGKILGMKKFIKSIAEPIFEIYEDYIKLKKNKINILEELENEEERFLKTLEQGIKIFERISEKKEIISGKDVFLLYQSYGFPIEMTKELAKEKNKRIDEKEYEKEYEKHQELSRTSTEGKFKSGLADHSEKTTRLHTATHLLMSALRIVLKDESIMQKGSNITPERLRLDFNFSRKLGEQEILEIEDLVNAQIQKSCEVIREEMRLEKAKKHGAVGAFDEKYGDSVSVYTIDDFSKEICSGPHVKNTCELGKFKIIKEESSSYGIRRIKAVLG